MQVSKTTFEHWGSLSDEHMEYNILDWLYFDGKVELVEFPKDKYVKAPPIIKTWDFMVPALDQKKMELEYPLRLIAILKDVV